MLNPYPLMGGRLRIVGNVSGSENAGHVGLEIFIDKNAVVEPDTGARGKIGPRFHTYPDYKEIREDHAKVIEDQPLAVVAACCAPQMEFDAMSLVQFSDKRAKL